LPRCATTTHFKSCAASAIGLLRSLREDAFGRTGMARWVEGQIRKFAKGHAPDVRVVQRVRRNLGRARRPLEQAMEY
jgi:hypothetical protein